ncbi:MAG: DUF5694 domain-containing protein [Candidatus Eremiobacteraeota bacterium]|nr:DUF5694 domain-containing protein [Candidatus Eremiobacteraeota bacterium]
MARLFCATIFLYLIGTSVGAAQTSKPEVMVLGVAHLVWRHDVHNAAFQDSPLSQKRQAQIVDIVDRLARFHPTKVLIEQSMGDQKVIQDYREYLAGKFSLPGDEAHQFGFRLAKRCDNSAIYPVDTWGPSIYDDNSVAGKRINAYLKAHFNNVIDLSSSAYLEHDATLERSGTYLDVLRFLNTDAAIRANAGWYTIMDGMGRKADDAGSMYTAQWYTRNVYIFSNILSVIHPGDRVVVMFGQGHEYLLREFVRLDPDLRYVDPLQYLK